MRISDIMIWRLENLSHMVEDLDEIQWANLLLPYTMRMGVTLEDELELQFDTNSKAWIIASRKPKESMAVLRKKKLKRKVA